MKKRIQKLKYLTRELNIETSNYLVENYILDFFQKKNLNVDLDKILLIDFDNISLYYDCRDCLELHPICTIDKVILDKYKD